MTEDLGHVAEDFGYMTGVPVEVKETFFSELSKYNPQQLALYFILGVTRASTDGMYSSVVLPTEIDNRRELVHDYLLVLPEDFRRDFRTHLDDDVQGDNNAEYLLA